MCNLWGGGGESVGKWVWGKEERGDNERRRERKRVENERRGAEREREREGGEGGRA